MLQTEWYYGMPLPIRFNSFPLIKVQSCNKRVGYFACVSWALQDPKIIPYNTWRGSISPFPRDISAPVSHLHNALLQHPLVVPKLNYVGGVNFTEWCTWLASASVAPLLIRALPSSHSNPWNWIMWENDSGWVAKRSGSSRFEST